MGDHGAELLADESHANVPGFKGLPCPREQGVVGPMPGRQRGHLGRKTRWAECGKEGRPCRLAVRRPDVDREAVDGRGPEPVRSDFQVPAGEVAAECPPDAPGTEPADGDAGPLTVVAHGRRHPWMADVGAGEPDRATPCIARDDGWRGDRDGHRHERGRLDERRLRDVEGVVLLDRDGQRLEVGLAGEVEEWQEEVIPREEEVEKADGHDRRKCERQDDRSQDPEGACPVDHRGVVELARDRQEILAEEEHVERVGEEVRNDERQPRPVPAELREDRVGRDERDLEGQDDRGDQDDEQGVVEREPEPGEAIGDERG